MQENASEFQHYQVWIQTCNGTVQKRLGRAIHHSLHSLICMQTSFASACIDNEMRAIRQTWISRILMTAAYH